MVFSESDDGLAQRITGISNPVEHIQSSGMQISFDDIISQNESETGGSKPTSARLHRVPNDKSLKTIGTFNGQSYFRETNLTQTFR